MLLSEIQDAFKVFGKIIFISQLAGPDVDAYKQAQSSTFEQAVTGTAEEFDLISNVLIPMHSQTKSTVSALSQIPNQCKATVENYLKKVLASQLELVSSTSSVAILEALAAEMQSASGTITPSGTDGVNADGFAMYFYDNFGVELPQDPVPNIPDSWIDDAIV